MCTRHSQLPSVGALHLGGGRKALSGESPERETGASAVPPTSSATLSLASVPYLITRMMGRIISKVLELMLSSLESDV